MSSRNASAEASTRSDAQEQRAPSSTFRWYRNPQALPYGSDFLRPSKSALEALGIPLRKKNFSYVRYGVEGSYIIHELSAQLAHDSATEGEQSQCQYRNWYFFDGKPTFHTTSRTITGSKECKYHACAGFTHSVGDSSRMPGTVNGLEEAGQWVPIRNGCVLSRSLVRAS
ncbi:uncharacterized protein I303_104014 [Kwoniella dejecticola CBS 10117]|uniref:Uncharacterized protein n=1 Tax=Kwoniella dejecticola CBS 10117 TaxID=1296121 RepID=A0A1A6A8B8_9TREE|nr:uncharacterized protein I303_04033 [Kwoniella dejecticola CBS 10117]OBR86309.1 hypothetical protein I303_04033 [Kwoniella dejecticola CBS 10117]